MGIVFDEKELTILGHYDSIKPEKPGVPKLNSPVTTKENLMAALNGKKPCWYPMVGMAGGDYKPFRPSRTFPDLFVAHDAMSGETPVEWDKIDKIQDGWFDTKWRYVDQVGGAMIEPGTEKIESIQDWGKLTWPDLDQLDWEGSAKANAAYLDSELPIEFCVPTTYWERIMSILGVSNAAVMMIEEEDKEACNAFFTKQHLFNLGRIDHQHQQSVQFFGKRRGVIRNPASTCLFQRSAGIAVQVCAPGRKTCADT